MSADLARLELARVLLAAGAGQSVRNVLGSLRGAAANRLRLASTEASLRPGFYGLVSLPARAGAPVGAALPLRPVPGHPRAKDPAFRDACITAFEHARAMLGDRSLPMLRFELEEELEVLGPSIGLPAALAFLAHFAPTRAPSLAVLATGELLAGGRVGQVGQLEAKHEVARQEHGARMVVFPGASRGAGSHSMEQVSTLTEAIQLVFGPAPLGLDVTYSAVDALLRRARGLPDAEESIVLLGSLDREALAPADRARVLFDLGSFHRNLGQAAAGELHGEAKLLLEDPRVRDVVGAEAAERYELEGWATDLDRFALDGATSELRGRLGRPFLKLRNELRCRGMLAQALAMAGDFAEAARVRAENLALHERSDALDKVRPATLCHLARDAAFAGDAAMFEQSVIALRFATRPGDEPQWRYNAASIVRGLVALGRDEDAVAWSCDERAVLGCRAPATLTSAAMGTALSITAPELSALRALVRALRRSGLREEAIAFGTRAVERAGDARELFGWMAALLQLEVGLADGDAETTKAAQERLHRTHPEATRFHARLLSSEGNEREAELDRVWY